MILSDRNVQEERKNGNLVIDPFMEGNLTPNGYDLSIGELRVGDRNVEMASVKKGEMFLISTLEWLELKKDLVAHMHIKSRWARKGVIGSFGFVDCGFKGKLTISFINMGYEEIDVKRNLPIVQIVFERTETEPDKPYEQRSGHFQNSKNITVTPL